MANINIELSNGQKAGETLKQLTNQAAALRKELGGLKPGTEDFVKSAQSLNQVEKRLGDVKEQVKQTTSASDLLKKGWNSLPGAGFFNQIASSFGMMKQGVGGLISSMGMLKGAIAATGIGLLVLAVAALYTWFTKTEAGADRLARVTAIWDAEIRQLTESFERLMNGDIIGFLFGMTIGMYSQIKAADDLAIALDNLEEKESAFQVVQKTGMRDKSELLKMTKDETLTIEDRIKAVDKAMGIAKALNAQEIENQRERLKIISGGNQVISDELIKDLERTGVTMENKKKIFKKGGIKQDDLDEVNQALGRFLEIQASAFDEERELLTVRNKLNKKATKETKDDLTDQKKAFDIYTKALQEQLQVQDNFRALNNEKKLLQIDDQQKREIEKLNQNTDEKILALQGSDLEIFEQTKLLRDIQGQELQAITDKYTKIDADQKLKQAELELATDQNIANEQFLSKEVTAQQYAQVSASNILSYHQQRLAIIKQQLGIESLEYQNEYAKILDLQKAAGLQSIEAIKWLSADGGKALTGSLQTFGTAFTQLASMQEQGSAQWKAFAVAAGTISAIQGSINAYASTSIIPIVGPALAPIAAGIALAAGMYAVGKIKSTKQPSPTKAASGGVFKGPSHAKGGIPIEVEGDEIIMTKGVYNNPPLRAMASAINVAGGGRQFATGGPVNPFENTRGTSSGEKASRGDDPLSRLEQKFEMYARAAAAQAEETSKRIDRIRVTNNLQDTEKGLKTLNRLREEADV